MPHVSLCMACKTRGQDNCDYCALARWLDRGLRRREDCQEVEMMIGGGRCRREDPLTLTLSLANRGEGMLLCGSECGACPKH
jgi:hypothetical protein